MAAITDAIPPCPVCASTQTRVVEDVSDEVTVFACDDCSASWALRADDVADRR